MFAPPDSERTRSTVYLLLAFRAFAFRTLSDSTVQPWALPIQKILTKTLRERGSGRHIPGGLLTCRTRTRTLVRVSEEAERSKGGLGSIPCESLEIGSRIRSAGSSNEEQPASGSSLEYW